VNNVEKKIIEINERFKAGTLDIRKNVEQIKTYLEAVKIYMNIAKFEIGDGTMIETLRKQLPQTPSYQTIAHYSIEEQEKVVRLAIKYKFITELGKKFDNPFNIECEDNENNIVKAAEMVIKIIENEHFIREAFKSLEKDGM